MLENPPIPNLEVLLEGQAEFLARGDASNEHVMSPSFHDQG